MRTLIRHIWHIADDKCIFRGAGYRFCYRDHLVHCDRQSGPMTKQAHGRRVADKDHFDSGPVFDQRRWIIISSEKRN